MEILPIDRDFVEEAPFSLAQKSIEKERVLTKSHRQFGHPREETKHDLLKKRDCRDKEVKELLVTIHDKVIGRGKDERDGNKIIEENSVRHQNENAEENNVEEQIVEEAWREERVSEKTYSKAGESIQFKDGNVWQHAQGKIECDVINAYLQGTQLVRELYNVHGDASRG